MIRRFSLINEYNQKFTLNNVHKGFLQNPSGLGMEREYSYTRLGNAWSNNFMHFSQMAIEGELIFASDPYNATADVLEYLRNSKALKLLYETNAGEYYKEVDLVSFGKSEITTGNVLSCPVRFMAKTLWRQDSTYRIIIGPSGSATGKAYTVDSNAYKYDYTYNEFIGGEVLINNAGSVPASFTVAFDGVITNPKIELIVGNTTTAKAEITGSASLGEQILYSSKDGEIYCYLRGQGGDTNLVSGMGLVNENFFKVPVGNSILKITASSEITNNIEIVVNTEYGVI